MILFLFFLLCFYGKFYINKISVITLFCILIIGLLNISAGNNSGPLFLKQFLGLIFNGIVYYSLFKLNNNNVDKLFRIYLKFCIVVAVIAIIQEASFLVGFKYGCDFSYLSPYIDQCGTTLGMLRVTSIFQEPSHFGSAMMPALFISILNILKWENNYISKRASCLIIISILLSFSVTAYVGIIIAFILIMLNHQRGRLIAVCIITLIGFSFVSYRYLPAVKRRVDDTVAVISGKKSLNNVNMTTFSFLSNGYVAYKSFMNDPLFGSGIGSHPISYDRYIEQIIGPEKRFINISKGAASSLFFRLISETGLFGVFLIFYFGIKFIVRKKNDSHFWIISNSILCLFLVNLIRMGNYFYNGFIFFVCAYYFTYLSARGNSIKDDHISLAN